MSRLGRDESEESIKDGENLRGKLIVKYDCLQIYGNKYLLRG